VLLVAGRTVERRSVAGGTAVPGARRVVPALRGRSAGPPGEAVGAVARGG